MTTFMKFILCKTAATEPPKTKKTHVPLKIKQLCLERIKTIKPNMDIHMVKGI